MAMQWITLRQAQDESAGTITIGQHWYLVEDRTRVVEEGHPDSRWLWASPGTVVKLADAIQLGAVKVEAEPEPEAAVAEEPESLHPDEEAEAAAEAEAAEKKKAPQAANKAARKAPNKATKGEGE